MKRCIKTGDGLLVWKKKYMRSGAVFELVPFVMEEHRQRERAI